MARHHSLADLAQVLSGLEEIKRLHRQRNWAALPERYTHARGTLMAVRVARADLSDEHRTRILATITLMDDLEAWLDEALERGGEPTDITVVNQRVNRRLGELQEILVNLTVHGGSANE